MHLQMCAWQDVVAGDGTTSVVVICGALLQKCLELLERGVHPTVISDSFNRAAEKAVEVNLSIPSMQTRAVNASRVPDAPTQCFA
jgi:T-complex protein 1 subunit delta